MGFWNRPTPLYSVNKQGEELIRLAIAVTALALALLNPTNANASHARMWAWYRNFGGKCVHTYEGSWTDPLPPYYGGFQMDLYFQQHFAPYRYHHSGTADHWTPYQQVVVVHKVVTGRNRHFVKRFPAYGWNQWPNTARYCGLL